MITPTGYGPTARFMQSASAHAAANGYTALLMKVMKLTASITSATKSRETRRGLKGTLDDVLMFSPPCSTSARHRSPRVPHRDNCADGATDLRNHRTRERDRCESFAGRHGECTMLWCVNLLACLGRIILVQFLIFPPGFFKESLKASNADFASHAIEKHEERWAYGHCSLAAAAYVVDPEFLSHEQENNEEVMEGFYDVVEKIGILKEVRRIIAQKESAASDDLTKKWEARRAMIVADPSRQKTWDHFPMYPTVESANVSSFCKTVSGQLALYRGRKGCFARAWVMQAADSMPAYLWWDQHGSSVAELQLVSRIILATPASASICERINSEFAPLSKTGAAID